MFAVNRAQMCMPSAPEYHACSEGPNTTLLHHCNRGGGAVTMSPVGVSTPCGCPCYAWHMSLYVQAVPGRELFAGCGHDANMGLGFLQHYPASPLKLGNMIPTPVLLVVVCAGVGCAHASMLIVTLLGVPVQRRPAQLLVSTSASPMDERHVASPPHWEVQGMQTAG